MKNEQPQTAVDKVGYGVGTVACAQHCSLDSGQRSRSQLALSSRVSGCALRSSVSTWLSLHRLLTITNIFEPSFSEIEQYRVKAPPCSADGVSDLLWLHRKQGLHVVMDVVQLALNHHGQRKTAWLLAVLGLETHVVSELVPPRTFEVYLFLCLFGSAGKRCPEEN